MGLIRFYNRIWVGTIRRGESGWPIVSSQLVLMSPRLHYRVGAALGGGRSVRPIVSSESRVERKEN